MERREDREARGRAVRGGLARLRAAASDGSLAALCGRYEVDLLTVHGSAARGEALPQDLDLGVRFTTGTSARRHLIGFVGAIMELAGTDLVDVMDVRRASPTARARALAHDAEVIHEAAPGLATLQEMAALTSELELAPLRRRQLELLAVS